MSKIATDKPVYARLLDLELERRLERNPRYSLRGFAKSLGMHPSTLGRILAGKQTPSTKACAQLVAKLKLDEAERHAFLESVVAAKAREAQARLQPLAGRMKLGAAASEGFHAMRSLKLPDKALAELRALAERFLDEAAEQAVDEEATTYRLLVDLAPVTPRSRS